MSSPITFTALIPGVDVGTDVEVPVTCQPLSGPGHDLPINLWERDRRRGPFPSDVYDGLSRDQIILYSQNHMNGILTNGALDTEAAEWQLISDVERNTGFYCGQLRENRQASLITIYGTGTLLLVALGVVAVATAPSRRTNMGGTDVASA